MSKVMCNAFLCAVLVVCLHSVTPQTLPADSSAIAADESEETALQPRGNPRFWDLRFFKAWTVVA